MPEDLTGQVAVVTGAGRGFGRAIAEGLAAAGAAVVVTSRTKQELDGTVASIEAAGGKAFAVAADVTSREDVLRVRMETEQHFGPANVVIHNAGVPWPFGPVWHVDPDRWWAAQAVHVRGALLYMNAFVPGMIERGGGRVIVITSRAGRAARPNLSGYAVAKNTQIRLVEHLAAEGAEHGIKAWAVHPGDVFTQLSVDTMSDPDAQKYIPGFVARLDGKIQANEDGTPGLKACADLCVALAEGRWDGLSGQYLEPDMDLAELLQTAT
jgi:NAD(P)-dependent dehydrogenase (short-subunit alcohol dehydrogenase family)